MKCNDVDQKWENIGKLIVLLAAIYFGGHVLFYLVRSI